MCAKRVGWSISSRIYISKQHLCFHFFTSQTLQSLIKPRTNCRDSPSEERRANDAVELTAQMGSAAENDSDWDTTSSCVQFLVSLNSGAAQSAQMDDVRHVSRIIITIRQQIRRYIELDPSDHTHKLLLFQQASQMFRQLGRDENEHVNLAGETL